MELNKEEANIIKLMDDALFDFTSESFKKGIEVIFLKPTEHLKKLSIDTGKIRFVAQCLIENAIKYSDKGDRIVIAVEEKGEMIELSFKDTGIGIPSIRTTKNIRKILPCSKCMQKGRNRYRTRTLHSQKHS
jgi:signal transduction histidine kinase